MIETINFYSIPAAIALAIKLLLLWQVRFPATQTRSSVLFFLLLLAFSIQNAAELGSYYYAPTHSGIIQPYFGYLYFSASIFAIAFMTHLAIAVTWPTYLPRLWQINLLYMPVALLQVLLWFTPAFILGFVPQRFTWTRVPGDYYFLFPMFVLLCLLTTLVVLTIGTRAKVASQRRTAALFLLGLAPFALLAITVTVLQQLQIKFISMPLYTPVCITVFLLVTGFAIHNDRFLFLSLPFKFNRLFYFRQLTQNLIANIDKLSTKKKTGIIDKLANAVHCPVAIVSQQEILWTTGASHLAKTPIENLTAITRVTVRSERHETELPEIMLNHNIGAIIPYRNNNNAGWLLFGKGTVDRQYDAIEEVLQTIATVYPELTEASNSAENNTRAPVWYVCDDLPDPLGDNLKKQVALTQEYDSPELAEKARIRLLTRFPAAYIISASRKHNKQKQAG